MYQQFYNFSAEPFRLSPDHGFAYAHKGYTKARAYMDYAFIRAEGFVMITGRPGTGKTTLIGALVDELADKSVNIANLVCTQLQSDDLLKLVAYDFGIPESVVEKGELLQRLTRQLKSWHRDGRRALLIVDEAQDLSISAMEELRLLTNIQVDSRPLLQIFLLGQPELRELILSPPLEQVHQRIIAASHLQPLERNETESYIRHRLESVHWQGDPAISKSVYPLVYKFSEGIPRRINLICSRLLLHCAVEERHRVGVADVREVVRELQDEKLASGDSFAESDFQVADVFHEDIPGSRATDNRPMAAANGKSGPSRDGDQAAKTVPGAGSAVAPGIQSTPAGSVRHADNARSREVEVKAQRKPPVAAVQAIPATAAAGRGRPNAGKPGFSVQPARAPHRARMAPAKEAPGIPGEGETRKSDKGRVPDGGPTSGGTGPAGTVGRGRGTEPPHHRVARPEVKAGAKRGIGSGTRESVSLPAWSLLVILLATVLLIAYGTWI